MRACLHPWGVYIQADEVLHERGAEELAAAIQRYHDDPKIEGFLVRYLHFYGGFDTVATHRRWYRREVRGGASRSGAGYSSLPGGSGLPGGSRAPENSGAAHRAEMFHYGWARPSQALREKRALGRTMYPWRNADESRPLLAWIPGIRRFTGHHPAVARSWIEARRHDPERPSSPGAFAGAFSVTTCPSLIERLTGVRVFEFRNYKIVGRG